LQMSPCLEIVFGRSKYWGLDLQYNYVCLLREGIQDIRSMT